MKIKSYLSHIVFLYYLFMSAFKHPDWENVIASMKQKIYRYQLQLLPTCKMEIEATKMKPENITENCMVKDLRVMTFVIQ